MHVTFVCSGNICRSPIAALVFTEHLRRAGLVDRVRVSSAGIGPWHVGESADPRAQQVLAEHGYPTTHVAAQVDDDHLDADLILAMDGTHEERLRQLLKARGDGDERLAMFTSFDPAAAVVDVPDPYYGAYDGFGAVIAVVEASMPGLLEWVRANLD